MQRHVEKPLPYLNLAWPIHHDPTVARPLVGQPSMVFHWAAKHAMGGGGGGGGDEGLNMVVVVAVAAVVVMVAWVV